MKHEVQLTPKPTLTIDDLKNTDHVGFVDTSGYKGFICSVLPMQFKAIQNCDGINQCNCLYSGEYTYTKLKEAIPDRCLSVYKFDTRKEMYKWLAED